jgi:L-alanine-DL-glutamate epimerase-like enolase superfamily enzyme
MQISSIDAFAFRLPVRRHFRWASLLKPLGGFVYVAITTDTGIVGVGEANPLPDWAGDHGRHGGETQGSVIDMIKRVIEPALIGLDPTRIEAAHATMDRVLRGNSYARCAIDMALHDLWGKALGQPLHVLLGGLSRERVAVAHMIGIMPAEEAVEEAKGAQADGITALQIKGGEDAARDAAAVRGIRRALGPDVFLRLDINQGYGRAKRALQILAGLAADLDMVEQPVRDLDEMAVLTGELPLDVIADESCWDAHDALELVQCRGADAISIYLAKAGGIAGARRVAAIAETAGLPCDVNGSLESAIGNAANLQFALATPGVSLPCVIPINAPAGGHVTEIAGRYYEDDVVEDAFGYRDGGLLPLMRPGLGITVHPGKLERYREA